MEPIVIVGGGPVGLTAAELLSLEGIPVKVIEAGPGPSKEWRASTFHAGTLELLEHTGIVEELMEHGLIAEKVQYRDRKTGLYAEFDFSQLRNETKYPFRLQCPQSTYVQLLNERLKKRADVEVLYSHKLLEFTQDDQSVTLKVDTPEGEKEIKASYLLGADGARSTVRKKLGLSFEGYTLEQRFLLVGTPVSFEQYIPDISYVNYIADPDEFLFILRVPEAWRFLYPVPQHISDEEALNPEGIQKKIQKALNTTDTFPIIEQMIYKIHQRVAGKFYQNRVIVLGDAAHINSPMGGIGLNSGIHDAVDLSQRLIRILKGEDPTSELDTYSDTRRHVALEYVRQITEKNTKVMTEKDENKRIRLQQELTAISNDSEKAKEWMLRSAMITSVREQGIGRLPVK